MAYAYDQPSLLARSERLDTIACVIPAYNEEETIAEVLESILAQTKLPDEIHVIVNNSVDRTYDIAMQYEGEHVRHVYGEELVARVFVHDIGKVSHGKVSALNAGWEKVRNHTYFLGVDGDTTLHRECLKNLFDEMESDTRIGGLSAIYSIDRTKFRGLFAKFLITGQKATFASFNMDNLLNGRNMSVLGGQCSLFRMESLEKVREEYHQQAPWVPDSEVEDSYLSLQIKKVGYSTKISSNARADVGPMLTLKALHAQQTKWTHGAIALMWPGASRGIPGQPFHPNLRIRWFENVTMLFNVFTRVGFGLLLVAALSIDAFVFNPIWLIPPIIGILLNVRIALSMKHRTLTDICYALLVIPAEIFLWIRISHFLSSWTRFLSNDRRDNWALQAKAESGKGSWGWVWPFIVLTALVCALWYFWFQWDLYTQAVVLSIGWPVLFLLTLGQTMFMTRRLLRRQFSYRV